MSRDFQYHLALPSAQWQAAVEGFWQNPHGILVGPTGLHEMPGVNRILGRSWRLAERGELSDWLGRWQNLCLIAPLPESAPPLLDWIRSLQAKPSHCIAVLGIGRGMAAGQLLGAVFHAGEIRPIERLELVGQGMPLWPLQSTIISGQSAPRDPLMLERWSRTIGALGQPVWDQLIANPVTIIGCGRSGSLASLLLALAGAKHMTLVDADRLEQGQLDAMFGVTSPKAVGRHKVEVVGEFLRGLRPDLEVETLSCSAVNPRATDAVASSPLSITTVDSDVPRLHVARLCAAYLRVHLDIGVGVFVRDGRREMGADVRLIVPAGPGGGCLACIGGLRNRADAAHVLLAPDGALLRGRPQQWHDQRAGSLATANACAVGSGLQMYFDLLAGRIGGSRWQRLRWHDDAILSVEQVSVQSDASCDVCAVSGLGDSRFGNGRDQAA